MSWSISDNLAYSGSDSTWVKCHRGQEEPAAVSSLRRCRWSFYRFSENTCEIMVKRGKMNAAADKARLPWYSLVYDQRSAHMSSLDITPSWSCLKDKTRSKGDLLLHFFLPKYEHPIPAPRLSYLLHPSRSPFSQTLTQTA